MFRTSSVTGFLAAAALAFGATAHAADITGAGATFPFPIYAKWAEAYKAKTGVGLNYQSIGSGGGIKQIQAKTVDFGATDAPLKRRRARPSTGSSSSPRSSAASCRSSTCRASRRARCSSTGPVLADIFLGKIKNWNDPAIAELNPGAQAARRARSPWSTARTARAPPSCSPTTWPRSSAEWKTKVGAGDGGGLAGRRGRQGQRGRGALRAADQGRDRLRRVRLRQANKMTHASMRNKDGQFVQPDDDDLPGRRRRRRLEEAPGFYQILNNQPGKTSWPITGASFILMHAKADKPENSRRGAEVLRLGAQERPEDGRRAGLRAAARAAWSR